MNKYFIAVCLLVLLCCQTKQSYSQYEDPIHSDRPGQSYSAISVGKNVFQLQHGFEFGGLENSNDNSVNRNFWTEHFFRYGLTERFDLNLNFRYRFEKTRFPSETQTLQGVNQLSLGTRINIHKSLEYKPSVGFQLFLKLPLNSPDYSIKYPAPNIIFLFNEKFNDIVELRVNLGIEFNGQDAIPQYNYVFYLPFYFAKIWNVFIETYGNINNSIFQIKYDTGFSVIVAPNVQLDCIGGFGINNKILDYFVNVGLSWRVTKLRNK